MDVASATFEREVIETSYRVPVVVDFWAPWCGPCRALAPILEKLAAEYRGRFKLVKVNSDQEPELASAFGVRSIPDVVAFKDGKAVSHFLGAQPERQVRAFIEKLLPPPAEIERARARELRAAGDAAGAILALEKALKLDPASGLARLDLVELLIETSRLDDAEGVLGGIGSNIDWDERADTLRQALGFARSGQAGAGDAELQTTLASNPADLEARLKLAGLRAARQRYREALDELLEIIRQDRNWKDGEAKKQILAIFRLAESQPELVQEYRRKLGRVLY